MEIALRPTQPDEAVLLTEIACAAKAHWGYTADTMAYWRAAFLTVTQEYIAAHAVWVASVHSGQVVAFAATEQHDAGAVLEHLWVTPSFMGRGIGRRLFEHVALETPTFTFTSDPHADDFYLKMGAQKIGEVASEYQSRQLSLFRY